jgi:glycosyltransferase involved in cell wall biosynthesis
MALTSIVILMGNRHDMTRRCVESIFRHTYEAFELVMVDNGSTDGQLIIWKTYPRRELLKIKKIVSNCCCNCFFHMIAFRLSK